MDEAVITCIRNSIKNSLKQKHDQYKESFGMNSLVAVLFLIPLMCCQEKPLYPCNAGFYRERDSLCRPCDEEACKTVLENKNTKYETCRGYCSSKLQYPQCNCSAKTVSMKYATSSIITSPNKPTKLHSGFMDGIVIGIVVGILTGIMAGVIVGLLMVYRYKKKNETDTPCNFITAVIMGTFRSDCCKRSINNSSSSNRNDDGVKNKNGTNLPLRMINSSLPNRNDDGVNNENGTNLPLEDIESEIEENTYQSDHLGPGSTRCHLESIHLTDNNENGSLKTNSHISPNNESDPQIDENGNNNHADECLLKAK